MGSWRNRYYTCLTRHKILSLKRYKGISIKPADAFFWNIISPHSHPSQQVFYLPFKPTSYVYLYLQLQSTKIANMQFFVLLTALFAAFAVAIPAPAPAPAYWKPETLQALEVRICFAHSLFYLPIYISQV